MYWKEISWFLVVVQGDTVVRELVVVDGCLNVEWIPHHRLARAFILKLLLRQSRSLQGMLVNELGVLDKTVRTLKWVFRISELRLGLTRVNEADAHDVDLRGAIDVDESGFGINYERIKVAKRLVVVGVVNIVKGHFESENVRLDVNWRVALNLAVTAHSSFNVDSHVGWLTEATLDILAALVWADEVGARHRDQQLLRVLDRAKGWRDVCHMRSIVPLKAEFLSR